MKITEKQLRKWLNEVFEGNLPFRDIIHYVNDDKNPKNGYAYSTKDGVCHQEKGLSCGMSGTRIPDDGPVNCIACNKKIR